MDNDILKKRLIGLTKVNIMTLGKKKNSIKEQISEWRQCVNRYLDDIQTRLLNEMESMHQEITATMFTNISKVSKSKISIEEFNKEIEKCVHNTQAFICNQKDQGDGDSLKKLSTAGELKMSEKIFDLDYDLTIEVPSSLFQERVPSLGVINTELTSRNLKDIEYAVADSADISERFDVSVELLRKSEIKDKMVVTATKSTKKQNGIAKVAPPVPRKYDIGGAAISEDDHILLADRNNKKLFFCHADGTIAKELDLPARPSTIVMINKREAAVCFPDCESKPEVLGGPLVWKSKVIIINIKEKRIVRELLFPGKCWSVSSRLDNKLIAACFTELCVFDIEKNMFTSRVVFPRSCIRHICTDDAKNVYFTDWNENSLSCIDLDNERSIYLYKHAQLKGPTSVAIDMDNRCYVVGLVSNNVHQVDSQGHLIKIILSHTDGIYEPQILNFKPFSAKFILVENGDNKKNLFKLYGLVEHFSSTCI